MQIRATGRGSCKLADNMMVWSWECVGPVSTVGLPHQQAEMMAWSCQGSYSSSLQLGLCDAEAVHAFPRVKPVLLWTSLLLLCHSIVRGRCFRLGRHN
jgi:hypothetical protein